MKTRKEPWEMTREELISHLRNRNKLEIKKLQKELAAQPTVKICGNLTRKKDCSDLKTAKKITEKYGKRYNFINDKIVKLKDINNQLDTNKGISNLNNFHYKEIKKAISEGKPVPAEVLKDYKEATQ